jgi:hypothetical protein
LSYIKWHYAHTRVWFSSLFTLIPSFWMTLPLQMNFRISLYISTKNLLV